MTTYEAGDGAPQGEYAVTIRWPPDVSQPSLADRLGGAYSKLERSKWSVTIAEAENELPPIEITGAKVQSKDKAQPPRRAPPGPGMGNTSSPREQPYRTQSAATRGITDETALA